MYVNLTSTYGGKHGIKWTATMKLDDLDFADDLDLLSDTQQQMQEKTTSVAATSVADSKLVLALGTSSMISVMYVLNHHKSTFQTTLTSIKVPLKALAVGIQDVRFVLFSARHLDVPQFQS
ncbi:unnamed protein product [Schistosoma margrebowiei]|uniref:Uncharacterized protein n=1 Tax=Schistosoma margrebowiei TaxID=48269 RepID=A0A183MQQ4_9TREM|nr:unnamed protein product [Schistosoma margrebowiei]